MKLEIKQLETSSNLKESLNKSTERVNRGEDDQSSMIKMDQNEYNSVMTEAQKDAVMRSQTKDAKGLPMDSKHGSVLTSSRLDAKLMASPFANRTLLGSEAANEHDENRKSMPEIIRAFDNGAGHNSSKATEPGIDTQMLHVQQQSKDEEEGGKDDHTQDDGESHVYNINYKHYDVVTDFEAIPYEDET